MHFADGSTGAQMHNRLPVLYHRATHRAVGPLRAPPPAASHLLLHPRRLLGVAGLGALRVRELPRRRDHRLDAIGRAGLAGARHAEPRASAAPTASPPISAASSTSAPTSRRRRSCSSAGPSGRRSRRCSACTDRSARDPTSPGPTTRMTLRRYRRLAELHERAVPLIHRLWKQAHRTGMPVARPMWLQFPGDRRGAGEDQQWMLGRNLLVAPVVVRGRHAPAPLPPPRLLARSRRPALHGTAQAHRRRAAGDAPVLRPLRHAPARPGRRLTLRLTRERVAGAARG